MTAIALNPDYADVAMRGKRLDEALASFDRAIALNPDYAEAYSNRGVTLKRDRTKRWQVTSVIALNPDYADAYSNRGNAEGPQITEVLTVPCSQPRLCRGLL